MLQLVDIGLVVFGGLFLLVALSFLIQGLAIRSRAARQLYTVARQASRREMNTAWLRGLLFLALSLILLLVWALAPRFQSSARPTAAAPPPSLTPSQTAPAVNANVTVTSNAAPAVATLLPLPSPEPVLTVTQTLTSTTPAETLAATARVNAPNGLLLRTLPNGPEVLELIPDGIQVVVLEGRESVGDLTWQYVRAPSGNAGWVALDFLLFDTP